MKKRTVWKIAISSIGLGAVLVGLWKGVVTAFKIESVEVVGDPIEISIDKSKIVDNLLFFPSEAVTKEIKKNNPQIFSLNIKKRFPHTLIIEIKKGAIVARLVADGSVYAIDERGVIFTEEQVTGAIPTITLNAVHIVIGKKTTDGKVLGALTFTDTMKSILSIQEISEFDQWSLQAKTNTSNIIFSAESDMNQMRDTLQTLFNGFRIKGIVPKTIDLRYQKPIIMME